MTAEKLAQLLTAAEVKKNHGKSPSWEELTENERSRRIRKAADILNSAK